MAYTVVAGTGAVVAATEATVAAAEVALAAVVAGGVVVATEAVVATAMKRRWRRRLNRWWRRLEWRRWWPVADAENVYFRRGGVPYPPGGRRLWHWPHRYMGGRPHHIAGVADAAGRAPSRRTTGGSTRCRKNRTVTTGRMFCGEIHPPHTVLEERHHLQIQQSREEHLVR